MLTWAIAILIQEDGLLFEPEKALDAKGFDQAVAAIRSRMETSGIQDVTVEAVEKEGRPGMIRVSMAGGMMERDKQRVAPLATRPGLAAWRLGREPTDKEVSKHPAVPKGMQWVGPHVAATRSSADQRLLATPGPVLAPEDVSFKKDDGKVQKGALLWSVSGAAVGKLEKLPKDKKEQTLILLVDGDWLTWTTPKMILEMQKAGDPIATRFGERETDLILSLVQNPLPCPFKASP